ncbi:MAG: DNA-binding protein [Candidatus Omnitrophica bacterium]|nr:DNA-binding protein [Candidatus Omnitrophota bacterium]
MIDNGKTEKQKNRKTKKVLMSFLGFWFFSFLVSAYAQPVTSTELINNAKEYDGSTVAYEGEVIGDIMRRGDFVWLNVKDGKIALGIWAHNSLAKEIEFTGEYKSKGDRIQVSGIFNRACLEHGGELDIHAKSIKKLNSGKMIKEKLIIGKRNLVIMLSGVIFLVWILMLLKRR